MSLILEKAKQFSQTHHASQKDEDGAAYFLHTELVAQILKTAGASEELIAAGYLHDLIEDTSITYEILLAEFGEKIATLVLEVTKSPEGTFPKLKSKDATSLIFANRLAILMRLDGYLWSDEKKQKYLEESKFWKS